MGEKPIRVLLVEDSPTNARLIQAMLVDRDAQEASSVGPSFELEWVDRLRSGLERLATGDIDVVLLDLTLPDSQGLDTFTHIHAQASSVPIIVLASLADEELAVRTIREGAQDYLVKGQVDSPLLARAIRYAIERKRAEEALALRVKQLTALSQSSQAVNASLELNRVLAEIVSLASEATTADYASVVLVDETGRIGRSAENLPGVPSIEHRIRDKGLTNWIMRSRQTVVIDEIDADGAIHPPLGTEAPRFVNPPVVESGVKSAAGLPLIAQDRLLGVLHLHSRHPGAFHGQLPVLTIFASQAATAIMNARLFATTQTAYEELKQAQAQLIQSARMAAVGALAAGVAHEINNPLTAILGLSELLLQNASLDDSVRKDLGDVAAQSRRVRDIVRGLLSFARQTEFHRLPTDVNQVVRETLDLIRRRLRHDEITVEERYAPDLPTLQLDVGRMKQVILNLVINAAQAMPQGGTIVVSSECVGDEVAVRIADTGVGIPAEIRPRIFEPFFSTHPVGQGMGLGLSISLGIVQEHGGRIQVESQEGKGSTFTVWLPVEPLDG